MGNRITIGADPEFAIVESDGELINAEDVLRGGHDCDSCDHCDENGDCNNECEWDEDEDFNGEFGADGCGMIFELRPPPHEDPLRVVRNIRTAMRHGILSHPGLKRHRWKAGGCINNYALGGHIHIGSDQINGNKYARVASVLNTYLAQPMLLIEDEDEALARRRDHGYGRFSDWHSQPWGIEYRTLSSWLVSPQVSAAALCLAKTVVHEHLGHGLTAPTPLAPMPGGEHEHDEMTSKFPTLWSHIQKMELYPKYKRRIDLIGYLVRHELDWFPRKNGRIIDMRQAWGITKRRAG